MFVEYSSTASQTINVQDITAPVIAALPAPTTINCPAVPVFAQATATDLCGSAFTLTSTDIITPGNCAGSYSAKRLWTATDGCGNSSTASQTITVRDIVAPVIAPLPAPSIINCPASPIFAVPVVTDACGSAYTLTSSDLITPWVCTQSFTIKKTWVATDGCGNSSSASQIITVQDITPPVISALPAPSTINCPATPVFTVPTATDACGSVSLTFVNITTSGACTGSYSVKRTWTASDACGNFSTASQIINVQDITAPVIAALPAPTTINCPASPVFTQATATDACGSAINLTHADVTTSGACAGSYSVKRTWTATDGCGNSSSASQTINVQDITAPVIAALPTPSTINCPASPIFAVPVVTDACGSSFTLTPVDVTTSGACPGTYSVTRTWTATDACSNSSTAVQVINVIDNSPPLITGTITPLTIEGCTIAAAPAPVTTVAALELLGVQITDACTSDPSLIVTSSDASTGTCAIVITRTYVVKDLCGNSSTTVASITITDSTPPTGPVSIPGTFGNNICYSNAISSFPFNPAAAAIFYSDNCGGPVSVTLTNTLLIGDNCLWILTYTFKVSDPCGNMLLNRKITHTGGDVTAPTGTPPLPSLGNNGCRASATTDFPFNPVMALTYYTDNCGMPLTAVLTNTMLAGIDDCNWGIVYVFKVMDQCGNTLPNQQMVITGSDQTAPTFTRPADITIFADEFCAYEAGVGVTGDVTNESDNCATGLNATYTDNIVDGSCACSHIITRTWSLVDACGNAAANQVQTISVLSNVVMNTNDNGPGSLRDVISCVPDGSTITFASSLMNQTITLTTGEILVNKNVNLFGPGMLHLTVSGNMASRVFHLYALENFNIQKHMFEGWHMDYQWRSRLCRRKSDPRKYDDKTQL